MDELLARAVEDLELSVRSCNVLQTAGITYVGELVQWSEAALLKQSGSGRKVVRELQELLTEMTLGLGMELPDWQRPDGAAVVRPG
jgi:DNA-directed RNA polymerase subunit alpha